MLKLPNGVIVLNGRVEWYEMWCRYVCTYVMIFSWTLPFTSLAQDSFHIICLDRYLSICSHNFLNAQVKRNPPSPPQRLKIRHIRNLKRILTAGFHEKLVKNQERLAKIALYFRKKSPSNVVLSHSINITFPFVFVFIYCWYQKNISSVFLQAF